jgi:dTDP-4-amino-4,6-dideoxygalactose transaminase
MSTVAAQAGLIYSIRVPVEARGELVKSAEQHGIPTGIHVQATRDFTFYRDARRGDLSVTDRVSRQELTLPLWSYLQEPVLDWVAAGVRDFFGSGS